MGRLRKNRNYFKEKEDINPMNYVSNLSDVMLILAVGIMLALILHWKVDIVTTQDSSETAQESQQSDVVTFSDDELETQDSLPENMERMGEVYYDPVSGQYYIVGAGESGN